MPQLLEIQMFLQFNSPEDAGSGNAVVELTADDILSKLNETEDKVDDKPNADDSKESSTKKEDKKEKVKDIEDETGEEIEELDELAELEEDLKTPTDEDLELKVPVQRRALMKDYPDIFKKHPGLESTIYRERAYTELLPTINDAKEALASLQTLERFEADLKQGKTTDIMKAVLADDPKAFAKMADNYMENLAQVDERAYHHVLGNITKDIVEAMLKFGKDKEDEAVQNAASILYQFMFNSTKWEGKKRLSVDEVINESVSREKEQLEKEKQEWEKSKQDENINKLMTSVDHQVKGTIEKSIDPKDQMSSFVKTKAVEEVLAKASKLLKQDTRFQAIVKQLTDRSTKEKFSPESLNRIQSAYFTKYKAILLPIVKAVRSEALKGVNAKSKSSDDETNDTTERANRDKPVVHNKDGNKSVDKNKPLPGESSVDFLLRRAK